jgi:hypothetical protein
MIKNKLIRIRIIGKSEDHEDFDKKADRLNKNNTHCDDIQLSPCRALFEPPKHATKFTGIYHHCEPCNIDSLFAFSRCFFTFHKSHIRPNVIQ